ncbi:hypothetical protein C1752_00691 [Acaryochloris thomasi RCC1774]|uniref:DUF642 domain-containing protein n=1 Tax=Acaryochloris thomasi RCC1774 TaxID=1764569 RepID=A0A2W1JXF2_9CYAN|nr:hypothetical protein [Acaryochloris thomasi]PZD74752.1 hypothetical protein C1752_00691 [Acaryochloris thomasi RCC1774]
MNVFLKVSIVVSVLVSSAASASSARAVSLLTNSGFETGDLTGWTVAGNIVDFGVNRDGADLSANTFDSFNPSFQNVRSGNFAAYAVVRTNPAERAIFSQAVTVQPDTTYSLGYWLSADSRTGAYGLFNNFGNPTISVNGSDIEATGPSQFDTGASPSDFIFVSGEYTTSQEETSVLVDYSIIGSGTARAAFSVDDFTFEAVPESSFMMTIPFVFGMVLILRRKLN